MIAGPARRLAQELGRRGLAAPARLLLDAHRPLAPLLSDGAAALDPLLQAIGGRAIDDVRSVIGDESGMESLIAELDEEERRARPR